MVKKLLLQCCALCKFHAIEGQIVGTSELCTMEGPNVCDQIAFYSYQSFLMEVQSNAGYIHCAHAQ